MRRLRPYLTGAAIGALALALVPLSGLPDPAARPGESRVTGWFHYIANRQSVTLRSLLTPVPPLDDPARVQRAAGHYALVCATCHGSPAGPPRPFARDLAPQPPPLTVQMHRWRPEARNFHTVRHGIRRSAMPGWATLRREDEVWDMVAFLQALPEMTAAEYEGLTKAGEDRCTACHGEGGAGGIPGVPRLDLQSPGYLTSALAAFRDGSRASGTMISVARELSDTDIAVLAERYGRSVPAEAGGEADEIARHGIPDRDVPACLSCHGDAARPGYPRLAGQDRDYLLTQLRLFKALGEDRGGPNAHIMAKVVRGLSEAEMRMLADYFGRP